MDKKPNNKISVSLINEIDKLISEMVVLEFNERDQLFHINDGTSIENTNGYRTLTNCCNTETAQHLINFLEKQFMNDTAWGIENKRVGYKTLLRTAKNVFELNTNLDVSLHKLTHH